MNPLLDSDFGLPPLRRSESVYEPEPEWTPERLPTPLFRYLLVALLAVGSVASCAVMS